MQKETEQYEERYKSDKADAIKKLEDTNKNISLLDYRLKEGAFAFFEWAAENPSHKKDAENALSILNEYYKKGDVKKTAGDATSYENLMASFDLYKQLNEFKSNNYYYSLSTNLSILAKAMVSCNRNVYSSENNAFNVVEHVYSGSENPIEYWYGDGKAVYDELKTIIKEKYNNEYEDMAMKKAKEEYKRIHGKEADLGHFAELLNRQYDIVAIATNSSKIGTNKNMFCLNAESLDSKVPLNKYDGIYEKYKRITDEYYLLKDKEEAEDWIKRVEWDKIQREKKTEDLKNHEDNETRRIRNTIKYLEEDIAHWEKSLKKDKEAYEKLK